MASHDVSVRHHTMKKSFSHMLVISVLLAIVFAGSSLGAGKKKKAPSAPEQNQPVVTSVTPTSITVTENKITKIYTLTQFTEINLNGQRTTAAALKPGMAVTVALGADPSKASRIDAMSK